ncbi:nesprin-2-like [Seriola dumerili]|uniref:nesprin-2-like n=1 Tax=Seriola dumerili TaxID=41447 RepID=UPI000BBEBE61|nr:nesprin-2-like [Seriola dumerili]
MSACHRDIIPTSEGSDVLLGEEMRNMELFLNLSESPFLLTSSPLELSGGDTQRVDGSWSQHGDLQECGQLEKRWVLWHKFMEEHAHLDMWLQLAEQAVSSHNSAHVTYITAKEELRKFERLRCEAGSRLVQLDGLTQRNRALTPLFLGAIQAKLLASARECGRRWDDVNAKLESITVRLKLFVSEWEGFEAEREELSLWLADLDVRLTEVDYLTGNTCEKLRCLQSFQQCVCVNSGRVNTLLQRGEALIQHSEPTDAQHIESRLLELLRHCSHVYNNIARTHTRLLSMRLVFEDDWILSQATDSGCPSETLLEEEGALDRPNLDLPAATHEHLGLEWDPSVDIGHSVSCDDGDSSYFSVSTGLCQRDGLKRWSYLSSLSSLSDITNQEADLRLAWLDHTYSGATQKAEPQLNGDQWASSTPDRQAGEPLSFDGGRVRAWLGVQRSAPPERRTSCSKAVQTDGEVRAEEEMSCCEEAERLLSEQSVTSSNGAASSSLHLYLLLATALTLLACLIWIVLESPCQSSNRMPRNFHLALRYVNGPPPT